ncbi:MAG: GTPase, partial [Lachnospirales bacterium]
MNKLNLIVMGKTGVGKSTLINAILDKDLATTGVGERVTKDIKKYIKIIETTDKNKRE